MRLARLIADNEPAKNRLVDLLFISRFDCPHDKASVDHVSRKFHLWTYRSARRGVGWPDGCNELWFSIFDFIIPMMDAGKMPRYKAVFTMEADGCICQRNWTERLHDDWDRTPCFVMGAKLSYPVTHINGNMVVSTDPEFLKIIRINSFKVPPGSAWDTHLAAQFAGWGWRSDCGISSFWNTPSMNREWFDSLVADGKYYIHGIKDGSNHVYFRDRFLS